VRDHNSQSYTMKTYIEEKCKYAWGSGWRASLTVIARRNMFARELLAPSSDLLAPDVDRYIKALKSQHVVPAPKRGCVVGKGCIKCYR
jgi:hypothetical protein